LEFLLHHQNTVTPACCMACLASESTLATSALMDFSFSSASYRATVGSGSQAVFGHETNRLMKREH
jgi:hypothetical protein